MRLKEFLAEGKGKEIFTFMHERFDIDLVRDHIEAGDVEYKKDKVDIRPWAEKILALKRDEPDRKPVSFMMRINYDHLDSITARRLQEPIYVVQLSFGGLIIDGNHRVAKAYMDGIDELPAFIFDEKNARKLQKPVKKKK